MNQIDVKAIVDVKFVLKSDLDPKDIKYYMTIKKWDSKNIQIKMNLTDPSMISQGPERDTIYFKFKNPELFRSKLTGKSMMPLDVLKQTIPRQVPNNVDVKELETTAQSVQDALAGIVYA